MHVHEAGGKQWQIRQICFDHREVNFSWSWDPVTKGVFRKELDHPRPVMVPCGRTWEETIMSLQGPNVESTIRLRYEAVIRAASEQHVAPLRQHMTASLKERDAACNPVEFLRALVELEAAAGVRAGLQPCYAPK
jgi:hypothetical protein